MENYRIDVIKSGEKVKQREEVPNPPGEFGVLWEARLVGICQTDREHVTKTMKDGQSHPLFHEIVGKVLQTGSGVPKNIRPGTTVVPLVRRRCQEADTINSLCEPHVCAMSSGYRSLTGQGFRKYAVDYFWNMVVVPEELANDDIAVLAEPMSLTNKIIAEVYKIRPDWRQSRNKAPTALVAGLGVGLLMAFALKLRGFDVTVLDNQPYESRRHNLLKLLNIPHKTVDVAQEVGSQLTKQGDTSSFDLVVDATGYPMAMEHLLPCVAKDGIVIAFSLPPGTWTEKVCRNNITIVGDSKLMNDNECVTKALKLWQMRVDNSMCIKRTSKQTSIVPSKSSGLTSYETSQCDVLISRGADSAEFEAHLKDLPPNSVVIVMGKSEGWSSYIVDRNITVLGCVNFGAIHAKGAWDDLIRLRQTVESSIDSLISLYSFNQIKEAFANRDSVRAVIKID